MSNAVEELNEQYFRDHKELLEIIREKNTAIDLLEKRLVNLLEYIKKLEYEATNRRYTTEQIKN